LNLLVFVDQLDLQYTAVIINAETILVISKWISRPFDSDEQVFDVFQ